MDDNVVIQNDKIDEVKFTQADIDLAVQNSLTAEREKFPSVDDMNELAALRQSAASHNNSLNAALARAENAEIKLSAIALGIRYDAIDDVISIARNHVNENCSLEDAIALVTQKYPQFSSAATAAPVNTGMPLAPSMHSNLNGVEMAFLSQNPWAKL